MKIKHTQNELHTFLCLRRNALCYSCVEGLSRVIAETEFTSLNWSPSKASERSSCRVTRPCAVNSPSSVQLKEQTVSSRSFRIFVACSLAANLSALTFRRSQRRGGPVLLCYVLDLCSSCHCKRTVEVVAHPLDGCWDAPWLLHQLLLECCVLSGLLPELL